MIAKRLEGSGEGVDIGGNQVVGDGIAQQIEPEERHLREHAALAGYALGQNAVECRDTIRGDNEQIPADAVDIADLTAGHPRNAGQVGGGENSRHSLRGLPAREP